MKHLDIKTNYGRIYIYNPKLHSEIPIKDVCSTQYLLEDTGHVMNTRILSCYNTVKGDLPRTAVAEVNLKIGEPLSIIVDDTKSLVDFDYLTMIHRSSNTQYFNVKADDMEFRIYFLYNRLTVEIHSENQDYLGEVQPNSELLKHPEFSFSKLGMPIGLR